MSGFENEPLGLAIVARSPLAGVPLTAATPTLLSWAVPNDGLLHLFSVAGTLNTTVATTGGAITLTFTTAGAAKSFVLFTATKAPSVDACGDGAPFGPLASPITCDPGTTVAIAQTSGLTGGAAAFLGAIFGL